VGFVSIGRAAELPLHADDSKIIQQIASAAGLDAEPELNPKQGWPNLKGELTVRLSSKEGKRVLLMGHDASGRVTKLIGNGPLLTNEAFAGLVNLTELRSIRIDHNTPAPGSGGDLEQYDGSGLAALADSKLEEIKIGHAFDDDGMAALAKIKSLRSATIGHSRATDAGIKHFAKHPNLEEFHISPQARPNRVTNECLPALATIPKLKRLGLHETFVTYDGGLEHLKGLNGTLEFVSFKNALVLPADVEKLKTDHPGLKIETSTSAEILAAPNSRGVLKWASPEAVKWLQAGGQ
ncbi:MAG: hypothetical protein C0483_00005, partial [Pirellula sp.]|nr:hypothetical protein [Pirellula sp.]